MRSYTIWPIRNGGGAEQSLARTEGFRSANEDFLLKLGDRSIKNVEVKPVEKDLHLWETLSRLYQAYGRHWKHKKPLSNTFDIWKLIRKFTLQWQWPENKDGVDRVLIMNPSFAAFYEVKRHGSTQDGSNSSQIQVSIGEFEQLDINQRPSAYSVGEVS